ncbi:MAG: IS1182 family transposase [Phycisphaerales bacterium]
MMGRLEPGQERLFYNFRLEDQIPPNHLVRKLDALLDFEPIRVRLEPFYSETGRPSVDPELMIRMLLIGYCYSIRSERKLCEEVRFNLAYKWFCGLGLEAAVPDHSTFSVNRHGRFRESAAFRLIFESVVTTCMAVGLVGGEGFAVDASVIEADASRYNRVEGSEVDWTDKQRASRPVQAYLTALDTENSPLNPAQKPKALSPSDPAAAWTTRGRHKVQFAYSINHLIDLQDGVIVDVEATPTRISKEVDAAETMLDRVRERFDLEPDRMTADVAYGTGALLGSLVERNIDPYIPVWDQSAVAADGKFTRADFRFDQEKNVYVCPNGKDLRTSGTAHGGTTLKYVARKSDCTLCPLKPNCTTGSARHVSRDVNEEARDYARALMETEDYRLSARQRKMIETGFGDLKRNLGLTRLRLRGVTGASDEFLLAATVQNLRRLANSIWPPQERSLVPNAA